MFGRDACKQKQNAAAEESAALYVHVPFCRSKCRYCDFYSVPAAESGRGDYLRAVGLELQRRRGFLAVPAASIFVGGGTPTVLGPTALQALLAELSPLADERTEFTVEANPDSLTADVAAVLRRGGVNRVSIGAQSFQPDQLALLGRPHGPPQVAEAVAAVRQAGIENISLDLIYGIPGQTPESWRASLRAALELGPEHLSCYALSLEEGTPLWADLQAGRIEEMDEDAQRDCYFAAIQAAAEAGLAHYEISNFARPGRQCRHNLTYWRNQPYLGIGPGAASYLQGERRTNRADLPAYAQAVLTGRQAPSESEHLTGRAAMAETLMLGLRLIEGVDRRAFARRFGVDPVEAFPRTFARYRELGLVAVMSNHVRLAREALFISNSILADILAEA